MLTYTSGINLFTGSSTTTGLTNNYTAANIAWGQTFINQFTLETLHKFPLIISEKSYSYNGFQTLPNTQFYTLPVPMRKISTVVVTVGNSTTYPGVGFNWFVRECPNLQYWNQLNLTNNIMSDIPQYFMVINGQLGLYPRPAVGYNPITIIGQAEPVALSTADITTATITTPKALTLLIAPSIGDLTATLSTNFLLPTGTYQILFSSGEQRLCTLTINSTAVVWTTALTAVATTAVTIRTSTGGEILTIGTVTPTATWVGYVMQSTDQQWYHIDGYINSTTVSISQPYTGAALSTAASTIGQASLIPQAYQMLPLYRAAELYYSVVSKDESRQKTYKGLADTLEATIRNVEGNKSTDPTIEDNIDKQLINPNLAVNITGSSTNQ